MAPSSVGIMWEVGKVTPTVHSAYFSQALHLNPYVLLPQLTWEWWYLMLVLSWEDQWKHDGKTLCVIPKKGAPLKIGSWTHSVETPARRRDDRLSFWPFVILLKNSWDTWGKQFSLVEESQGNVCVMAGEGRMPACHQAALGCSFESFQVINGKQSGDNNSQASQNAIFEMGA